MRLRAVILEDDTSLRSFLREVLEGRGYEVFDYPDASLCPLATITECRCPVGTICTDILITDVRMPHSNGIDFIRQLLDKKCRRPQIAIMSGSWTEDQERLAERLRCKTINKPFQIQDLTEWLDQVERRILPERLLVDWRF